MKLKNLLKSKGFLVSVFIVVIVAILLICWFVSRKPADSFQPEEPVIGSAAAEWQDTPSPTAAPGDTGQPSGAAATPETYPKVTAEDDTDVVIDFTPGAEELQTEPPAPPVSQEDNTDPSEPPSYEPEQTAPEPSAPAPQAPQTPEAGSSNGNGAVYDPVFGWVVPGDAQQSVGDSDGDIDKMVGNMGE